MELPDLFHAQRLSEDAFSHLTDNVVLLQYVRQGTTLKRALTVVKSRGTRHDPQIHEFDITERATLYSSTEFKKIRLLYFTDDFKNWEREHGA